MVGYDDVISIEHEDIYIGKSEGLGKAVTLLKNVIFEEKADQIWN
jgi:sugar phosphate isomerase/epimerase